MADEIISVEPTHGGLLCRLRNGVRTVSVGNDAQLIHYTQDGITYKQGGKTKYYDLKTNGIRVLN